MQHLLNFPYFHPFEKKLHIAESKLEISCNIIDDFRHQYELSLDEIYDLQGEIDELVDECRQQKHTILTLNSKLSQIQKKYKTQSEKIDQILQRYNYHEFRKYQKRESYHKKVISEQKAEIKKLKLDTQKLETVESEKRKANKSMAYFKKQNSEYREINQNQKQVILQLQRDLSDKDRNIDNLIAQVNELIEDKMSVETFSEGEYLPSVRQVVQDLHSFGVGVKHIGQTIQTVLKHLVGIKGVKVPSESSNRRMILESNLLAKLQVGEKMLSHGLNTLHFDGTTDAQKHFLGFQISTPGQNLSLSISETIRGDTQTQVDTLKQVFNDLSDVMSSDSTEENKDKIYANLMISVKNLMSDQHIVNKIFLDEFTKLRTFLLEEFDTNWCNLSENEKERASQIHQYFCHLHVLANMGDSASKALKEYEQILTGGSGKMGRNLNKDFSSWNDQDSAAIRSIRTACSLLASGGSSSSGCPEDFKAYLASKDKLYKLKKFEHNRFNVIFENAGAVVYHKDDIIDFLSKLSSMNMLQRSVLSDLKDENIYQEIVALAIIGKIITTPFMKLVDSKTFATHILDLNKHFHQLQIDLKHWSSTPDDLLTGISVIFPDFPPAKDVVYQALFNVNDTDGEPQEHGDVTIEVISLTCSHLYLTVSRLMKNQLPGGCHTSDDEAKRQESISVPKHNRVSEKNFADMKQIRHFKPNASIEHIEATLMWINNKTIEWLDSMDLQDKNAKIRKKTCP